MRKTMKQFQNWWRRQDASAAKEALAADTGKAGRAMLVMSGLAAFIPPEKLEPAISKYLEVDMTGFLSVGDGHIAVYMLAFGSLSLTVSLLLSLKPKTQAKAKKKP